MFQERYWSRSRSQHLHESGSAALRGSTVGLAKIKGTWYRSVFQQRCWSGSRSQHLHESGSVTPLGSTVQASWYRSVFQQRHPDPEATTYMNPDPQHGSGSTFGLRLAKLENSHVSRISEYNGIKYFQMLSIGTGLRWKKSGSYPQEKKTLWSFLPGNRIPFRTDEYSPFFLNTIYISPDPIIIPGSETLLLNVRAQSIN